MVRIDKFIWAVRLYKTRNLASSACKEGKIRINETVVKPSKLIGVGNIFSVKKQGVLFQYKILNSLNKRVAAKLVDTYIQNITPIEELERYKLMQLTQKEYRKKGLGRPTKKERRNIDQWENNQNSG